MRKLLFMLLLAVSCLASAQNSNDVPFNGIVTDLLGNPIKGARIWVVKTRVSKSDKEGKFGLTNVLPTDTIHIRYQRKNYDVVVGESKGMRIRLGDELQAQADDELANIGYGFVKKREKTVPSSGISGEDIIRTGKTNLLQALDGLVPGYSYDNGSPVIRGKSSINLSNEPLYIVDGMVVNSFDFLNIFDIDRVEVLKDGSIYGSRGANGVIIVTTKRGK